VIGFVGPFYFSNRATRTAKGLTMVGDAHRMYGQALNRDPMKEGKDALAQAQNRYQEVATGYGGSEAEVEAVLGLANCDYASAKYDQAEAAYGEFVRKYPGHAMAPVALAGTGYCLEAKAKNKEAAQAFLSVSTRFPGAANLGASLMDAARNFEAAGDKDQAKAALERLQKEKGVPEALATRAKAKLEALKGS
jgi:TolA-binding protein